MPKCRKAALAVKVVDDGHPVNNTQLLGPGHAVDEWPMLLTSLQQVQQDHVKDWHLQLGDAHLQELRITQFNRAQLKNSELVFSEAYERVKSRFSHLVVVEFPDQGLSVAWIKFFVTLESIDEGGPTTGQGSLQ